MSKDRNRMIARVLRTAVVGLAVGTFALSSQASAGNVWVLQGTSAEPSNFGPRDDACIPNVSGGIGDGQATFGFQNAACGNGAFFVGQITYQITWDSPPSRIVPGETVSVRAAVTRSGDASAKGPSFAELQIITRGIAGQLDSRGMLEDPNWQASESKTMTFSLYNGEPGAKTDVKVYLLVSDGGGFVREQAGGYFVYHYVLEASEAAPSSQGVTPDASASNTSARDTSTPATSTSNTSTSSTSTPAASASSESDSGTSVSSALDNYETKKAAITATAAVLGGLLVSIGAAIAAGLSGIGLSDVTSTLSDLFKGKLPSDGFDDWKNRTESSGKLYGTGTPDDPYRDYPDASHPPWKAPYGDGTAAHPYSDTPPPVIEPAVLHTTTVDLTPVNASGEDSFSTPFIPRVVSFPFKDAPVRLEPLGEESAGGPSEEPVPDEPTSPEDHIDRYGEPDAVTFQEYVVNGLKLEQVTKALQEAVDQLKSEGYFVANPAMPEWGPLHVPVETLVKIWHNVPHGAVEFAGWIKSKCVSSVDPTVWSDSNSPYYKEDPAEREELIKALHATITDPHWGQCGQAVEWGRARLDKSVKDIFGPDAVFTQISITSNTNEDSNHVANEVILPNGERYVVDVWATMVAGKPRIYREDKWIEKWKNDTWVGRGGSSVARGAPGKEFEGQLESHIREDGVEEGIKKLRAETAKHSPDDGKSIETVVKSYRANPWEIKPHTPAPEPPKPSAPDESGKFGVWKE